MADVGHVSGTTPQLTPRDLQIEIPAESLFGSLPVNRGLTVSIHIPKSPVLQDTPLVAVFEMPSSAPYTVPLEIDHARHRYSATVNLGRLSGTMGTPLKATVLQVIIGHQQGLHVEALVHRTVVVTLAIPGYADHRSSHVDLADHITHGSGPTRNQPTELALLDGAVEEEELVGTGALPRKEGYWKMLQRLIHKCMTEGGAARLSKDAARMSGIGFRLYANGEAQLIEVERSSGNVAFDQAAVLAVVNAHPFPPFPPGTKDTHVDVHVDIPALPR
ncbi:MAG: energy transducer TonB [Nitrospira sp.]|nr:energy transducer TonB [Nitrospira sp.]